MTSPLFSIITPTFNSSKDIRNLADSIFCQTFVEYEWIIIDGGSTDGTINIIEKFSTSKLIWSTEPDSGIYDAMNKGITRSRGEYLLFMGADDQLNNSNVLEQVKLHLSNGLIRPHVLLGVALLEARDGFKHFCSAIGKKTLLINSSHHQATFYRADLFDNFRYDINFKVVSDYELNLRIYLQEKIRCDLNSLIISRCASSGLSNKTSELKNYRDMHLIRCKYMNKYFSAFIFIISVLNIVRRKWMWGA